MISSTDSRPQELLQEGQETGDQGVCLVKEKEFLISLPPDLL
jgi:hypothetical protein